LGAALEKLYGDKIFLMSPSVSSTGFQCDFLLRKIVDSYIPSRLEKIPSTDTTHSLLLQKATQDAFTLMTSSPNTITSVSESMMKDIAEVLAKLISSSSTIPFEKMSVAQPVAIELFYDNPFKLIKIASFPPESSVHIFRYGDFIDLCPTPNFQFIPQIHSIHLLHVSAAQLSFQSTNKNHSNQSLTRISAISFPSIKTESRWRIEMEELQKRDHRVIGKTQQLFTLNPYSPGSPTLLNHGFRISNRILDLIRGQYRRDGYEEVVTPLIFNKELWEKSGHWQNYRDDMFLIQDKGMNESSLENSSNSLSSEEHVIRGLKPMNCPGHCLIFQGTSKSYKELPVRIAEFSPLHR